MRWASSDNPISSSTSSTFCLALAPKPKPRLANTPGFLQLATSRLRRTVNSLNTLGIWNFRPRPARAILCSSQLVMSVSCRKTRPEVDLVLPVIRSIKVVLPAPLAPSSTRSSPSSITIETWLTALKPSKSTLRPSMVSAVCAIALLRQLRRRVAHAQRARGSVRRSRYDAVDEIMREAAKATRQIEHDEDEDQADHGLPGFGKAFGLAHRRRDHVNEDGADAGAEDRRAPADRGPHHHGDGEGQIHERRRGELRDDHIEHAGEARDGGRYAEEEGLIGRHVEAEIARPVLIVSDGLQDDAGPGVDQQPRADQHQAERDR